MWRVVWRIASDYGAGSVLALGVMAVVVMLTTIVVGVSGAWAAWQRAAIAADAAALAAADVAVGRATGDPCTEADRIALANGATVKSCLVTGVVVSVVTAVRYTGWEALTSARAGPPGTP